MKDKRRPARHRADRRFSLTAHLRGGVSRHRGRLQRERQHLTFVRYQATMLTDAQADHAILSMYREGIISATRIAEVLGQWQTPAYEEWGGPTAWRLFNAATFALLGKVVEQSSLTPKLHRVIDQVVGTPEASHEPA